MIALYNLDALLTQAPLLVRTQFAECKQLRDGIKLVSAPLRDMILVENCQDALERKYGAGGFGVGHGIVIMPNCAIVKAEVP